MGRRRLRNSFVAAFSLIVVVLGGADLVSPTGTAWAVDVSAQRIDHDKSPEEIIYGRVTDLRGRGIRGVRVTVLAVHGRHIVVKDVTFTDGKGVYRKVLHLPSGTYFVSVDQPSSRKHLVTARPLKLHRGTAYRVGVVAVRKGLFTFLPVSSY